MNIVPTIQDKRPPFVRFDQAEFGLDVEETAKQGRPVPKMIHMAYITPHGSKDVFEQPADGKDGWLARIMNKARNGEYPLEWAQHFNAAFKEYLQGSELPRQGTPIISWAMIASPTRRKQLVAIGIPTVEDLAEWPDSGLGQIGLDGRYLRDMAKGWVLEAKLSGSTAKDLADARSQIETLTGQLERANQKIDALAAQMHSMSDKKSK